MKVEVMYSVNEERNTAIVNITLPNGDIYQIDTKDTTMSLYAELRPNKSIYIQPATNSGLVIGQSTKQQY